MAGHATKRTARSGGTVAAASRPALHANGYVCRPLEVAVVGQVLSDIRRQDHTGPARKATPLELTPLGRPLDQIDARTLRTLRDRALLLLGFAAALRR